MTRPRTGQPLFFRASSRLGAALVLLPALLVACQSPEQQNTAASATTTTTATTTTSSAETAAPAADDTASGTLASGSMASGGMAMDHSAHAGHAASGASTSSATASSASTGDLPLEVQAATVRAVPPSIGDTAAYVTLHNPTDQDIVLTGAASDAAEHVMLMQTMTSDASGTSMSGMVETPQLTVPAGGELKMGPGGDHVMLMGLKEPLKEGSRLNLTLQTQDGRTLEVSAEVQRP